jgi:hypothetical protein
MALGMTERKQSITTKMQIRKHWEILRQYKNSVLLA